MAGSQQAGSFDAADERPHADAAVEEWVFSAWDPAEGLGMVCGYRLVGSAEAWYWWALARLGRPLLHVAEWGIARRSDPMIAKATAMWAEHVCDSPFEQWTLGNETYAVALDDPDEALGRAYGRAEPVAMDAEWYATAPAAATANGYEQAGVVHATIETAAGPLELAEVPAHRVHRWAASSGSLPTWRPATATAHLGPRAPFAFPDGSIVDLVLTADGWRTRHGPPSAGGTVAPSRL